MWVLRKVPLLGIVALRKESVDRNELRSTYYSPPPKSLSARRAWIEMLSGIVHIIGHICRSPQGERG